MALPLKNGTQIALPKHLVDRVKQVSVAPEGRRAVLGAAAVTALTWSIPPLRLIGAVSTGALAAFYRNPARVTPREAGAVVSPADGLICAVDEARPPLEANLGDAMMRHVAIYLSMTDVHVQRAPLKAKVVSVTHTSGEFLNARDDAAADRNERTVTVLDADGQRVVVVQIAGLIARRIVNDARPGATIKAGEVFGMIRLGSRVEIFFPLSAKMAVLEGQRSVGGETILARL
jgi:phosphatidylserine decarboxylase